MTVDGVDRERKADARSLDGQDSTAKRITPVKGTWLGTRCAYKMVSDRTNDITAMKGGKMVWNGRDHGCEHDGKSRTVNISGTGADGKKFKAKAVYDKVGSASGPLGRATKFRTFS